MKAKLLTAIALAAGPFLLATSAHAEPMISIGVSQDGASPVTVDSGASPLTFSGTTANFTYTVSATGTPPLPQPDLDTSTVDVQSNTSASTTLKVFVTETGLTSPTAVSQFISGFTSNLQSANQVTMETLIDTSNGLYGGTVLGGPVIFNASTTLQTSESANLTPSLAAPYSETAEFVITTTGVGQEANLTINIVPAPSIGHGLLVLLAVGGMLFGGELLRGRKNCYLNAA